MKSWNNLYGDICSFDNLWRAACAAERGKRLEDAMGRIGRFLEGYRKRHGS